MEPLEICLPTLLVAAATLSVVPEVNAASYTLNEGAMFSGKNSTNYDFAGDTLEINSGTVTSKSEWREDDHWGAWIAWTWAVNTGGSLGSSSAKTTIKGTGFLGLAVEYEGSKDCVADLTNVDASGFTGQLCVVNLYSKDVTVMLSGDWSGTEYIFGSKTTEWDGQTTFGNASGEFPYTRGIISGDNYDHDTLALQGDTTLAGITGTSKDYSVGGINVAERDSITVASDGTKLTLTGSSSYEFYGTVGASDARVSLSMTGSGSQTFGGTNYLKDVSVSNGTLVLGGTTTIDEGVTVSNGGTLSIVDGITTISGTVDVSSAIQNAGEIIFDASNTTFVLDNLTSDDGVYTIVSGGTVSVLDGGSLSLSNFTLNGVEISGRSQIIIGEGGLSVIYSVGDLTWAGTLDNNVWTTSATDWQGEDGSSTTFYQGDNVTFGANTGSVSNTIVLGENIEAGTVTITGSGYTLTAGSGTTLTAVNIIIDDEESGTGHTFTIGESVSVTAGSLTESAGQLDLVVHGSLTVSGMTITSEDSESISGDGALTVGALTHSSLQGQSLTISVSEATFENIYTANHSGYGSSDSNNTDGYHTLIFGSEGSVTNAIVTGRLELWGTAEVSVAAGSTLTVGTLTDSSGYKTSISGDGTLIVDAMTFAGNSGNTVDISIANLQAGTITISSSNAEADSTITISSANFTAGSIEYGSRGDLTISSENFTVGEATFSGTGAITITSANFTADSITVTSEDTGAITISSANFKAGYAEFDSVATITISQGADVEIGSILNNNSGEHSYQIDGNLTTGSFSRQNGRLTITVNGTMTVDKYDDTDGYLSFAANQSQNFGNSQTLTGTGTVNVYGLQYYASSSNPSLNISVAYLNIGEGGIVSGQYGSLHLAGTTVGLYQTNTLALDADMVIDSAGAKFNPTSGQALTLSGVLSGEGAIEKIGAGTLILSAENTFSGGLTISAGTVVAQNASALSTGDISVADGAALQLDVAISVGDIEFADGAQLVINSEILESTISPLDATTEGVLIALITADSIKFGDTLVSDVSDEDALSDLINSYISFTTEDYELSWKWDNGTLYITSINPIPEPELFSIFFGISALGMMATRRRRRKVA